MLTQVVDTPLHFRAAIPMAQRTGVLLVVLNFLNGVTSGLDFVVGIVQHEAGSAGSVAWAVQHDGASAAGGIGRTDTWGQPQLLAWHCSTVPQQHTTCPQVLAAADQAASIGNPIAAAR